MSLLSPDLSAVSSRSLLRRADA